MFVARLCSADPMTAKYLENVLARFVAVHIDTGLKKDSAGELNKRHEPTIL